MTYKTKLKNAFQVFSGHFLAGVILKSLRASLLLFGGFMVLSTTSAWKFMESSFAAHDLVRAAAWTRESSSEVLVIGIDDTAYEGYFGGLSPLKRNQLQALLATIQNSAVKAEKIVVDLDLTPSRDDDQSALADFFTNRPGLWVIADPVRGTADDTEQARSWREKLCSNGVLMGRPYLPTDFGYVNPRYQYQNSLSQAASFGKNDCLERGKKAQTGSKVIEKQELHKVSASMSPQYASTGFVLPFHGDLNELATLVKTINPRFVVLGGMWGTGDVLDTPFGDRYGAQLHGAAIDGAIKGYHAVPLIFNLVVLWISISLMTITLSLIKDRLEQFTGPHISELSGHQFLMEKIWPLFALALIFAALVALAEVLAIFFSLTGLQIETSLVAGTILTYMVFVWNFGLGKIVRRKNTQEALKTMLVQPVKNDFNSLRLSTQQLIRPGTMPIGEPSIYQRLSRGRAAFEAFMSLSSLLLQTLFPTVVIIYALYKSF